jgi:hypothetical protein
MPDTTRNAEEEVKRMKEYMLSTASIQTALISIYATMLQPSTLSTTYQWANPFWVTVLRVLLLSPIVLSFCLIVLLACSMRYKLEYFTDEQARKKVDEFRELYYENFMRLSACSLLTTVAIIMFTAVFILSS